MDNIMPYAGYRVNTQVNGIPLDECSYISADDEIRPYFEELDLNDPDVTSLVVFLRNSAGDNVGWKVIYDTGNKTEEDNEDSDDGDDDIIITVKNLNNLPLLPLPEDLPADMYTIVYQVMGGKNILQRTEKPFFYLGGNHFSFNGISAYLPGVTESHQLIPKGMTILLETKLDFDSSLDPYIVWYNGKRKVSEGKFSGGARQIFWKAPEQSGFYSFSVEIFPAGNIDNLAGYKKETSLLVSSMSIDLHLVPENIPQLVHWYTFEGNLNDSKLVAPEENALIPAADNKPVWMSSNNSYGLATGFNNIFTLPKISVSNNTIENYEVLFRFHALAEGKVFSVSFDSSGDVSLNLYVEEQTLILTLESSLMTVSKSYNLPILDKFPVVGVNFSVLSGLLYAKVNIIGDVVTDIVKQDNLALEQISLNVDVVNGFQILLGFTQESNFFVEEQENQEEYEVQEVQKEPAFTALWDEFALYYLPPMDVIAEYLKPAAREELPEADSIALN